MDERQREETEQPEQSEVPLVRKLAHHDCTALGKPFLLAQHVCQWKRILFYLNIECTIK